jgi:antitoxin (DNA-binding transcriptional repressor) of toxin-antitoxin stability system
VTTDTTQPHEFAEHGFNLVHQFCSLGVMMQTVNIHEAKTNLSRLIALAGQGQPFVIAKAGKPLVMVNAIEDMVSVPRQRLGFMGGSFQVPDDFDRMGENDMAGLFAGGDA